MRALVFLLALLATPVLAQDRFMPTGSCTQVAGFEDAAEHRAMERYLYFVTTSLTGQGMKETDKVYAELRRRTGTVCVDMPYGTSLQDAAMAMAQSLAAPAAGTGLMDEAHAFLGGFLDPGADLAAMTAALKPTPADLAVIFKPDFLPLVTPYVEQIFGQGVISPKAGQSDLLIVPASTSDLIDQRPVLGEFPGGYRDLLPYLNRDIPVVRFKFVKPGETLGMAFDGLYKVNGRWVMIPKAWRAVPQ